MKIIKKSDVNQIEFSRLEEGDVFNYNDGDSTYIYLKVEPAYDGYGSVKYNSVDLKTNELDAFPDSELVTLLKASLIIE